MSIYAMLGMRVYPKDGFMEFSRPPNIETLDLGEVSVYAFSVCRGDGEEQRCVDVKVKREEIEIREWDSWKSVLEKAKLLAKRKALQSLTDN